LRNLLKIKSGLRAGKIGILLADAISVAILVHSPQQSRGC
jgi:hypothetical protein